MFKGSSRALLWVLLLIIVLPVSAYASQETEWQAAANGKTELDVSVVSEHHSNIQQADSTEEPAANSAAGDDNDDGDNDDGDNDDDGDATEEVDGYIESFPAELIGEWVVDGVSYTALTDTLFIEENGAFAVGACVEVEYEVVDSDNLAREISSEEVSDCENDDNDDGDNDDGDNDDGDNDDGDNDDGDNDDGDNDDGDNDDGDNDDDGDATEEVDGYIESFPAELIGEWVVDGVSYTALTDTLFIQENGAFAVGACVEVEYDVVDSDNLAREISSEDVSDCENDDNDDGDNDDGDNDDGDNDDGDNDDGDNDDGDNDDGDNDDGDNDDGDNDDDNDLKVYGLVESFPADLVGEWVIGGATYTADADTEFEQEHGAFAVGACVEIEYLPTSNQALQIESEHSYKCEGSGDGGGEPYSETTGVIESYPSSLIGTWTVDGVDYTASASTRFEQEDGPFFVGACVEIKYTSTDNAAVEIESQEASDCGSQDDGSSNSRTKLYGLIETVPDGLIGAWTVGGMTFEATSTTEFEQEHGDFTVGMCVEVTYTTTDEVNNAIEIESEDAYHCTGGSSTNELVGIVNSFPTGLYGTWVISGTNVVASPSTDFSEEDDDYQVGDCVKARYYTENGVNQAIKIESEDDSCHSGGSQSNSKVYATIDSFPESPHVGTWQIGGLTYDATNATEFDQDHGAFAVATCVEAKYATSDSGNTLIEVETENPYKCGSDGQTEFTAYATVQAMPTIGGRRSTGLAMPTTSNGAGTWQISGVAYQADESTQFEQEYGFFAVGAYVEVKYEMSGDSPVAKSIETHVAPGNGMQTEEGVLDSYDANDEWNDWTIAGVTYKADPAIEVGSGNQAPQIGESVTFNSYENNGVRYLTTVNRTQTSVPTAIRLTHVGTKQTTNWPYWPLLAGSMMMMGLLVWRRIK